MATNAFGTDDDFQFSFAGAPPPPANPGGDLAYSFSDPSQNTSMTPASDFSGGTAGNIADQMTPSSPAPASAPSLSTDQPASSSESFRAPTPSSSSAAPAPDFTSAMSQIESATDPAQREVLRDKLARDISSSLSGAGHDVKWNGSTLMVDGRPYTVAGTTPAATDDRMRYATADTAAGSAPPPSGQTWAVAGASENTAKFNDPSYSSPKYDQSRLRAQFPPTPEGNQQFVAAWNAAHPDQPMQIIDGDKTRTSYGDVIDWIKDSDGPNPSLWYGSEQEYAAAHPGGQTGSQPNGLPWGAVAPEGYVTPPGALGYQAGAAAPAPWAPGQGAGYTPGDIPMDTPEFSYDQLFNQAQAPNAIDGQLDDYMQNLLAHPESLDQHTVDTLKAKQRDTLAEQAAMDDQEAQITGANMGIGDSNWLASERNARRWQRDSAMNKSAQDIDINAATTNMADRRAAGQLGLSYQGQLKSQKQQAMALAADTTLRASALKGDRLALRESVNQKAKELGISSDQVMSSWLLGMADDATRRYGIDVSKEIDLKKLSNASQEFKEELAYKLAALAQDDAQFGAKYGLDAGRLQLDADTEAWKRFSGTTS